MLAGSSEELAAEAFRAGVLCTVITLGARGAIYFAPPDLDITEISATRERRITLESARSELVAPPVVRTGAGVDPTGCGDVWGATFFSRLLLGDAPRAAIAAAHEAASRNAMRRGIGGLVDHLRVAGDGRIP